MNARRKVPHPLLRFIIPLAIAVGALMVSLLVRWVRTLGVTQSPSVSWTERKRVPESNAASAPKQKFPSSEPSQRVEDLPLARLEAVRKLGSVELTPELIRKADEVLRSQFPPLGAEIPLEVQGKLYIARVERHFHEVGGPKRPWGYHRGMTLYWAE